MTIRALLRVSKCVKAIEEWDIIRNELAGSSFKSEAKVMNSNGGIVSNEYPLGIFVHYLVQQ